MPPDAWRRLRRALATLAVLSAPLGAQPEQGAAAAAPPDCPPTFTLPPAGSSDASTAATRDRGLLWRIRRDGRTSFLYGSLHVGRPEWLVPGPTVAAALRQAELLALELDVTDPRTASELTEALPHEATPALPAALQQRLDRQIDASCLDAAAVRGLPLVAQLLVLSLAAAQWEGLHAALGTEFALAVAARQAGLRIVALETAAGQVRALTPPDATRLLRQVERALDQLEDRRSRDTVRRLAQAWERGRLDELEAYEHWCQCIDDESDREQMRRLNDERNGPMAERIVELHGGGRRLFVAVGMLHMTGAQSLPRLLADRGFAVERIAFDR